MKKIMKICLVILLALILLAAGFAAGLYYYGSSLYEGSYVQWEDEVLEIEARYGGEYPQGEIIFYGSSSIRMWETMDKDLAPLEVLNHGFGGSSLNDAIYYADRLVFPFNPKAVVIYSGTNDMGSDIPGYGKDAREAYLASAALISYLQTELPDTEIYYIASTPNEYRWDKWERMNACNEMMQEYCESHECVTYIDTVSALLDENGMYRPELFLDDGLHFNEKGYEVWTEIILPILLEIDV